MRHGASGQLAATLAGIGPNLAGVLGDFRTGYDIGRHVLAVCEARDYEPFTALVRYRCGQLFLFWGEPLEHAIDQSRSAQEGLARSGDLHMAGAAKWAVATQFFDVARSL